MNPIIMTYAALADILDDMAQRVRNGDSFEGSIEYLMPEPGTPEAEDYDNVAVVGSYRIGNSTGQGGYRMISAIQAER